MRGLKAQRIEIWRFMLHAPPSALTGDVLSADERVRVAGFHFARDQRRFVLCRAFLRQVLATYLEMPPQDISLKLGPNGKPELANGDANLQFNLSHSGEHCIVAVADGVGVGVDIEDTRDVPDLALLIRTVLGPNEISVVEASPDHARSAIFLRFWTRKEAIAKATGAGLDNALIELTTTQTHGEAFWPVLGADRRRIAWRDIPDGGPTIAAVAAFGADGDLAIEVRTFDGH